MDSIISSLVSFSNPTVKNLLKYKLCNEDEKWTEKAIECLVKKLKNNKKALENLEQSLKYCSSSFNCVTIPKSMDGRMQVQHRKCFPHVIYCKIFRWPNLKSHNELQPLYSVCSKPHHAKLSEVCVNPYHYVRVQKPNNENEKPYENNLTYNNYTEIKNENHFSMNANNFLSTNSPLNNFSLNQYSLNDKSFNAENSLSSNNSFNNHLIFNNSNGSNQSYENFVDTDSNHLSSSDNSSQFSFNLNNNFSSNNSFNTNNSINMDQFGYNSQTISQNFNSFQIRSNNFNSNSATFESYKSINLNRLDDILFEGYWCSIANYEFSSRIGGMFNSNANHLSINGYSNSFNKNCLSLNYAIGDGIDLFHYDSDIYIHNLTNSPVFVQGLNMNISSNSCPNKVVKIIAGSQLKIFDMKLFKNLINLNLSKGFEVLFELVKHCVVRLSFFKGWGSNYHRQEITNTPCWIEIHFNGLLKFLDTILTEVGAPNNPVSSVS